MKKIKEVYKEAEKEKENEVDDVVKMPKKDYVKEHKELPEILRSGTQAERNAEADKQEKELAAMLGEDNDDEESDD